MTGATITNLQFFANDALVGIDTTSPFSVNASNLAAGDYSLTARARDTRGMNGTSAPVDIRVIDRPLLVPQPGANGLIPFSFNTVTGLNYIVQASTNQLSNWSGLVTNRATTTNQSYIETSDVGPLRFYRVILQPQENPMMRSAWLLPFPPQTHPHHNLGWITGTSLTHGAPSWAGSRAAEMQRPNDRPAVKAEFRVRL